MSKTRIKKPSLLSKFKFSFGIRSKILFAASFLLAIPYMSYEYVWELENYLREGQEQTLIGTARAVATVLHERPTLFDNQAAFLTDITPGTDLYAHQIDFPIKLDGLLSDWQSYQEYMISYGSQNLVEQSTVYNPSSITFEHMVGKYGQYLYAVFNVTDENVVMREANSLRIDRNDALQIAFVNSVGKFERYIVAPYESGWVNAYKLDEKKTALTPTNLETRIQGHWENTERGYNLELRFPLSMLSNKIAFAVMDVDNANNREVKYVLGTANPSQSDALGTILVPSPEIEKIIKGLEYSKARIWVLDRHMRVLARSGDIVETASVHTDLEQNGKANLGSDQENEQNGLWAFIKSNILLPIYYKFLTKPPEDFIDDLSNAYALQGDDIEKAMGGKPSTLWRLSSDKKAVILSAAHPIFLDNQVMGAVVVEQTTHGIRTLRNQALEKQFNLILIILFTASMSLFTLSSIITSRIRRLRDDTDSAIDANGKIISVTSPSNTKDEIGDLSRSFHDVLTKLSQYNSYLENMASRLSHELRTPVAVVNSSLDNLLNCHSEQEKEKYINRAKDGINRLSKILNSMSEATRLEQAIHNNEPEQFSLVKLLPIWVESYNHTYADANVELDIQSFAGTDKAMLTGSPDMLAQMLDKVVTNAKEFKQKKTNISIRLFNKNSKIMLSISNKGPLLPENTKRSLLNSMISVRPFTSSEQSHLGLGLFIANMIARYHNGQLSIDNLPDHTGVIVVIEFE